MAHAMAHNDAISIITVVNHAFADDNTAYDRFDNKYRVYRVFSL